MLIDKSVMLLMFLILVISLALYNLGIMKMINMFSCDVTDIRMTTDGQNGYIKRRSLIDMCAYLTQL